MSLFRHIYASLKYYWKAHFLTFLGVVVSTMVLTGTMIVGDSVRSSLEQATELRLGKTAYMFSGIDRYFRASLADSLRRSLQSEIASIHLYIYPSLCLSISFTLYPSAYFSFILSVYLD